MEVNNKMEVNKKNGFTLVELLAVIVILAVLILLTLPTVLRIMDTAKRNSLKTEALSIINAAETKLAAEGALGIGGATDCLVYSNSKNDLDGYIDYKKGYTAKITKSASEFTINISNGTFVIKKLTKKNQAEAPGSSTWTIADGNLTGADATCP